MSIQQLTELAAGTTLGVVLCAAMDPWRIEDAAQSAAFVTRHGGAHMPRLQKVAEAFTVRLHALCAQLLQRQHRGFLHGMRPANDGRCPAELVCPDPAEVAPLASALGILEAELVSRLRRRPECFERPFDDLPELPEHHELPYREVRFAFRRRIAELGLQHDFLVRQILKGLDRLCLLQSQPELPFTGCAA